MRRLASDAVLAAAPPTRAIGTCEIPADGPLRVRSGAPRQITTDTAVRSAVAATPEAAAFAWPSRRDVHLWTLDLRVSARCAAGLLDGEEIQRARRFVYAQDARRYVAAHAGLRRLLGRYLDTAPERLRFATGAHGKPLLVQQPRADGRPPLRFNLSHSKDFALVAVAAGFEVGVDIEAVRGDLPGPDLAAGVLSAAEMDEFEQCPRHDHAATFVGCWTRKEACLKALGVGLGIEPRALSVGLHPDRQALRVDGADAPVDIAPLPAPPGYCAALAAVGGFDEVVSRDTMFPMEETT